MTEYKLAAGAGPFAAHVDGVPYVFNADRIIDLDPNVFKKLNKAQKAMLEELTPTSSAKPSKAKASG